MHDATVVFPAGKAGSFNKQVEILEHANVF